MYIFTVTVSIIDLHFLKNNRQHACSYFSFQRLQALDSKSALNYTKGPFIVKNININGKE